MRQSGGGEAIVISEHAVPFSPNFRLYMTTSLPNPHLPPEACASVTLLNFSVTTAGLEDQLLSSLIHAERPELHEARALMINGEAARSKQLRATETSILQQLASGKGEMLDNVLIMCL